jgi:kumamolisin
MSDLNALTLTLVFYERELTRIGFIADVASDPTRAEYGQHLTREELDALVALPADERALVADWLTGHGMTVLDTPLTGRQLMFVRATIAQVEAAFGAETLRWLNRNGDNRGARIASAMPRRLAGYVQKVGGLPGEQGQVDLERLMLETESPLVNMQSSQTTKTPDCKTDEAGKIEVENGIKVKNDLEVKRDLEIEHSVERENRIEVEEIKTDDLEVDEVVAKPSDLGGVTPDDIKEIYNFPDAADANGSGETVALMMLGGHLDERDLHTFWRVHGIQPPEVEIVDVGFIRQRDSHPLHMLEAGMTVEWAGAMARGAKLVIYRIDPTVMGDPWSAFLLAVVNDQRHRPTIACTSWITPERRYYTQHGHSTVTGLLNQAAALGITVVSAAGDWGPFDGIPRTIKDGRYVSDAAWCHGVFPAVEEQVLAVGGTMITHRQPLTEIAWSGPPPPGMSKTLHFERIAGSGGFSEDVPIPDWQRPLMHGWYSRGAGTPAVVPYGRGFPDVALMAAGATIQRGACEPLTSQGYQAFIGGKWIDYAGGTSVAAPIWAAIIALANGARRAAGLSRLGFVNPLLYKLRDAQPAPFREITAGAADVAMTVVNAHGRAVTYHLPGYECRSGWDPVTGLGVPHVANLIQLVCSASIVRGEKAIE